MNNAGYVGADDAAEAAREISRHFDLSPIVRPNVKPGGAGR